MPRINLINSKTVFFSTLIVVPTLTLIVYLTGINQHRTLYLNSIILFLFIFIGLYNGWKLKDNLGNIIDNFNKLKKPKVEALDDLSSIETL